MPQKSVTWTIGKQKNIALIAHDSQKPVIIQWCEEHKDILKEHFLHEVFSCGFPHSDIHGSMDICSSP